MSNKDKDTEVRVACLECDTETFHKVLESIDDNEDTPWGYQWSKHQIIRCSGCHAISFRKKYGSDDIIGMDDEGVAVYEEDEELYPSRIRGRKQLRYHEHLPQKIKKIYSETHQALSGKQPILARAGIRALVEAVCAEKKLLEKT